MVKEQANIALIDGERRRSLNAAPQLRRRLPWRAATDAHQLLWRCETDNAREESERELAQSKRDTLMSTCLPALKSWPNRGTPAECVKLRSAKVC
jgi:hypothetical protein